MAADLLGGVYRLCCLLVGGWLPRPAACSPAHLRRAQLLFYVGGIALLTLLVNGTSSGVLLDRLGMCAPSPAARHLDPHVEASLARDCVVAYSGVIAHIPASVTRYRPGGSDSGSGGLPFRTMVERFSSGLREADAAIAAEATSRHALAASGGGGTSGESSASVEDELPALLRAVLVRCLDAQCVVLRCFFLPDQWNVSVDRWGRR